MASIQDILRPKVVTKIVSRVAQSTSTVLNFMKMQPGGALEEIVGGRHAEYHVFNNVRTTGIGRGPGTAAARRARNPVGRVPFTFPRMHEQIYLLSEEIHNFSRLGMGDGARDEAGADYVRRQMEIPGQRAANWRTAMVVGMLKDSLYMHVDGDDWYPTYSSSGNLMQINYQMPSGNKSQLDMLGDGDIIDVSWDNSTANIPLHLGKINAAFQQLCGGRLDHIHCTQTMWQNVINNDYVVSQGGTSSEPFETFQRITGEGPDGTPLNEFVGRIRAFQSVEWHISDDGLEIGAPGSESFTKHWDDTACVFMAEPRANLFGMKLGSEPIAEKDGGSIDVKVGLASWTKNSFNPTGYEAFVLDNCLPVSYIPNSHAYGTVVF